MLAALLIVAGLAISAPPSCVCAPDEHFGLLLHPMFPHTHGEAHGVPDQPASFQVDQSPALSAFASSAGAPDAIAGLLLPLFLAAMLLLGSRRLALLDVRPEQRALAPPIPPPRLVPSIA